MGVSVSACMKGARPFKDNHEIHAFVASLRGKFSARDRAIAALGLKTGSRISQMLALRVGDVYHRGRFVERVYFKRSSRKGKIEGQSLPLHPALKMALGRWLVELRRKNGGLRPEDFLFPSRKGNRPIGRKAYWEIMHEAADRAGLSRGISPHSLRKSVAYKVYEKSGHDLLVTSRVLGHRSVLTTASYLGWGIDGRADSCVLSL